MLGILGSRLASEGQGAVTSPIMSDRSTNDKPSAGDSPSPANQQPSKILVEKHVDHSTSESRPQASPPFPSDTTLEDRMSAFERSMRWLTGVQTVVAVVTCLILGLQLNEMRTGSKDTHDLAVAAKSQSDASKAIAESSKSQSDAASQIASSTTEEVKQLKASVAEEHSATQHAELSLQQSERPWVNAESMEVHGLTPPDQNHPTLTMSTRTILRNTGKSVATNGRVWILIEPNLVKTLRADWRKPCMDIERQRTAEAESNKLNLGATWPIGFVLTPGQSVAEDMNIGGSDITPYNSQSGYWVLGCANYDDQFGNHHHTNFCFQTAGPGDTPDAPKFKACNGFQEAN
jgi:hypothetical protein